MIVIKNTSDISLLSKGDSYIINYGIDYNNPLSIDYNRINTLQTKIEELFNTENEVKNITQNKNKV